jgi:hypothetical protein
MPDDVKDTQDSPQGNGGQDVSALTKSVETLSAKVAKYEADLSAANEKIKQYEGQVGGLTTAQKQAVEKATNMEQQLKEAQKLLEGKTGEITNWATQHQQLNEEFGQTTAKLQATEKELGLYKTIAGDPNYHGLIGMVPGIKLADTPEDQKVILDSFATGLKGQINASLDAFRAGGTPPGNPATPAVKGPKNVQEAALRAQQIAGIRGHEAEFETLQQYIMSQSAGGQQPA